MISNDVSSTFNACMAGPLPKPSSNYGVMTREDRRGGFGTNKRENTSSDLYCVE